MRLVIALFVSLISLRVSAKDAAAPSAGEVLTSQAVINLLIGLSCVVLVILVLAWLLKRVNGLHIKHQKMKVLSSIPLGTRERAVLLQVGSKQLLLGVAPGQVNLLESFAEPVVPVDKPVDKGGSVDSTVRKTDFLDRLQKEIRANKASEDKE